MKVNPARATAIADAQRPPAVRTKMRLRCVSEPERSPTKCGQLKVRPVFRRLPAQLPSITGRIAARLRSTLMVRLQLFAAPPCKCGARPARDGLGGRRFAGIAARDPESHASAAEANCSVPQPTPSIIPSKRRHLLSLQHPDACDLHVARLRTFRPEGYG
jgi:hypothetical protein